MCTSKRLFSQKFAVPSHTVKKCSPYIYILNAQTYVSFVLLQIRVGCYAGGGMGESWRPVGPPPPPRLLPGGAPWPRPLPGGAPWPRPHRPPSPPPGRGRRVKGTQNRQWVFPHICLCKHFMRILLKSLLICLTRIRCRNLFTFTVFERILDYNAKHLFRLVGNDSHDNNVTVHWIRPKVGSFDRSLLKEASRRLSRKVHPSPIEWEAPSRTVIAHYALNGQMRSKAHTALLTAPLVYIIQGFTNALWKKSLSMAKCGINLFWLSSFILHW